MEIDSPLPYVCPYGHSYGGVLLSEYWAPFSSSHNQERSVLKATDKLLLRFHERMFHETADSSSRRGAYVFVFRGDRRVTEARKGC